MSRRYSVGPFGRSLSRGYPFPCTSARHQWRLPRSGSLQIFRAKARMLGHFRQSDRAQFLTYRGKRNDTEASRRGVASDGNKMCGRCATQSAVVPQAPAAPWSQATRSCGDGELQRVGGGLQLSVLDLFGNHAKCEGLGLQSRFFRCGAVHRGTSGISPIQRPSSSRRSRIVSCICFILPGTQKRRIAGARRTTEVVREQPCRLRGWSCSESTIGKAH